MEKDNSSYHIPNYTRPAAYAFVVPDTNEVFEELSAIAEEIALCRSNALQI